MPDVISHENVVTEVEPQGPSWHQQFEYLVLRHDVNGNVLLEEYRTGNDKSGSAPLSQGAVNAWVLFHPANLAETRFRYLGRQRMDGHATLVLAFAQTPDKVKFPGQVKFRRWVARTMGDQTLPPIDHAIPEYPFGSRPSSPYLSLSLKAMLVSFSRSDIRETYKKLSLAIKA
jgi:hypothetical protein